MKPRILVIGDSFLDEYLYCSFVKQNPEASGSVFKIDRKQYFLGGAAAVANMCVSLGAKVELVTAFAEDDRGEIFHDLLKMHKVDLALHIVYEEPYRTIVKTRYVVNDILYPNRFDDEYPGELQNFSWDLLIKQMKSYDVILISDYGKGVVSSSLLSSLPIPRGNPLILIDPTFGRSWADYAKADIIKCNQLEADQALLDMHCKKIPESSYACHLADIYEQSIVVTLGERGLQYCNHCCTRMGHIPAIQTEKKDICGAGDTIFASLGFHLGKGENLQKACECAVQYAAQQIQSFGIRPLEPLGEKQCQNTLAED